MNELLTTKQVQDYLKVDRTTIYRMLKDGRLNGIKVGKQWRFPRSEIEGLSSVPVAYGGLTTAYDNALPLDCVQTIQDVTADTMEVGAVVTDEDGFPLTAVSNSSRFCQLILGTESGRQACMASWRRLFRQGGDAAQMTTCHAGCQVGHSPIVINGRTTTQFVAGQFHITPPKPVLQQERIRQLAQTHGLDEAELAAAAQEIPVLPPEKREKIARWLQKLAGTFSVMAQDRMTMLDRFRKIADMSTRIVQ